MLVTNRRFLLAMGVSLLFVLLSTSCSNTKFLKDDEKLYTRTWFKWKGKKKIERMPYKAYDVVYTGYVRTNWNYFTFSRSGLAFYNYMKPKEDWSRWEKPGDVATHPSMQNAELSRENSSRFLEDGSFIKVRSVRLSYSFPQNMITKLKLKELNVSLGADNLFTLTNFWGQDPEVTLNQGDWSMPGVTSFKYPNNKLFVFSLNIKF